MYPDCSVYALLQCALLLHWLESVIDPSALYAGLAPATLHLFAPVAVFAILSCGFVPSHVPLPVFVYPTYIVSYVQSFTLSHWYQLLLQ